MAAPVPGLSVPSTVNLDVSNLEGKSLDSPEFRELIIRLQQQLNNISLVINYKTTGIYDVTEIATNEGLYRNAAQQVTQNNDQPYRTIYSVTVELGQLPNTGTKTVPHGLTVSPTFEIVSFQGEASDQTGFNYISLNFYDAAHPGNAVSFVMNANNIVVTTTFDASNFNESKVIIKYVYN